MVADPLHGFLDALIAWLLTYALHSTVLIAAAWLAAVLIARAACRSQRLRDALPSIRERLWKLALVGGLVTASTQSVLGLDPWGLQLALRSNIAGIRTAPTDTASVPSLTPDLQANATPSSASPSTFFRTPSGGPFAAALPTVARGIDSKVLATESNALAGGRASATASANSSAQSSETFSETFSETILSSWVAVVLALWCAGVLFGLVRWACQWNRLLRNLDDREPIVSGHVFEIFQHLHLRSHVKRDVRLSAAPGLNAPITLGVWRNEICLPPRVATELQHDEIGALLAHELAHAERRDPSWVVACRAIEIVFFFQPLNRICASWLADEAEYLCDDRAVVRIGERVALASCLTEIAGWIVHSTPTRLAPGMAAPGTRLSLRVGRLLDEDHDPAAPQASRWFTAALAPVALSVAVLVPGVVAEARTDDDDPTSESVDVAADSALLDRARELEIAWQSEPVPLAQDPEPETYAFGTPVAQVPDADAVSSPSEDAASMTLDADAEPDADGLTALGEEIARMRADLATRKGGNALLHRLDALEARRKALEQLAGELQGRLDELDHLAEHVAEQAAQPAPTPVPSRKPIPVASVYTFQVPTKD